MGGTRPQQTTNKDYYRGILGISPSASIKDVYKAYKSLIMKWSPDKNPSNKKEAEAKIKEISEAYDVLHDTKNGPREEPNSPEPMPQPELLFRAKSDDESFLRRSYSILGRNTSRRRSKTPTPARPSMASSTSRRSRTPTESRRSPTPTFFQRNWSRRNGEEADQQSPSVSRDSTSRRSRTPTESRRSPTPTFFQRNWSRRNGEEGDQQSSPSVSRDSSRAGSVDRDGYETAQSSPAFSRSSSRSPGPTPILFSSSTSRSKPPPIEEVLECTLEDLCFGCVKKIMVTRDVMTKTGQVEKEDEALQIKVNPGWKKGTKITFEGKGDKRRGTHPADIIFTIEELKHSIFRRHGDDLEVLVEIPLLKALTGCTLSVPLLGGEEMKLAFDDVIYPGFVKIIRGQGMPKARDDGRRGDLCIRFLVKFPEELSEETRREVYSILKDC